MKEIIEKKVKQINKKINKKVSKNKKTLIIAFIVATLIGLFLFGKYLFNILFYIPNTIITGVAVIEPNLLSNLMVPTTITSIVLSVAAFLIIVFLIFKMKKIGVVKTFPFKNYIAAISMIFVIYIMNYFITLFPYGNLIFFIVSSILQIMVYGILLPYILLAQISYIVLLFKGDIRGILR